LTTLGCGLPAEDAFQAFPCGAGEVEAALDLPDGFVCSTDGPFWVRRTGDLDARARVETVSVRAMSESREGKSDQIAPSLRLRMIIDRLDAEQRLRERGFEMSLRPFDGASAQPELGPSEGCVFTSQAASTNLRNERDAAVVHHAMWCWTPIGDTSDVHIVAVDVEVLATMPSDAVLDEADETAATLFGSLSLGAFRRRDD